MDGLMLRGVRRITARLVLLLLPMVGLVAVAPVASAMGVSRLVVTAVKSPPSRLAIRSVFRVRDMTRNVGGPPGCGVGDRVSAVDRSTA
jgi:hypothetical protein